MNSFDKDGSSACIASETTNNEDDICFKQIAEKIANSVWNDPQLTSYKSSDEDEDTDIEILDPDLINPDAFDWQAHDERIKKLVTSSIRSYVRNLNKPFLKQEVKLEDNDFLEREKNFIKLEYKKIFEMMRKAKSVKTILKIRKLKQMKRKKERQLLRDEIKRDNKRRERRMELQIEAENVVIFWIGNLDPNNTISAVHVAEKIVAQHIKQMETFLDRKDKIFEFREKQNQTASVGTLLTEDVKIILDKENKINSRITKLRRTGSRSYIILTLLKKFLKKKLISIKKLKAKDPVCKRCQENEAIWRAYRNEFGYTERLTRDDGRKFYSMLVQSGEMRILIDYFKILLSKPVQKIEEQIVNEEPFEDDVIDSLIREGNNAYDVCGADQCLLCSMKCERRALPCMCTNK